MPCLLRSVILAVLLPLPAVAQDLVGHGGPVGALALEGDRALSGGFDTRAILWDMDSGAARNVTRFHDGNVTAVALFADGRFATAGQDGRVAIWQSDSRAPEFATGHGVSAISSLALSPDQAHLAAGFWDGTVQVLDLGAGGNARVQAHGDRVTGLVWLASGKLVSVGSDLRMARWSPELDLAGRTDLPDLPNGLAVTRDRLAVVFAEGALRLYSPRGDLLPERFLTDRPLVAVAARGGVVTAGAIDGTVWLLEADGLSERFRIDAATGPVWALATEGDVLLSAGADGMIRRWSARDGAPLGQGAATSQTAVDDGSRGAQVWRACAVCHSLEPGDQSRAGPSLHGIFGQRIATRPGYDYSEALQQLDIVWTKRTVAELFEFGPEAYTPGSRMPEQRVASAEDRQALVEFIERMSR
ncbi:c-type cytochrome [Rhodobacteraceae bacterium 2376]|uniref:C-type cytochrome n=1 Tax=Rhabdonatronobacter sediminivivens TaxID=2743469 RepID=A0A7Z0HW82_9RHOB|nr:c-type cytochrome [Rhabdonatronobacter sediminivivens]NYS23518.1 c-type cytochrome [Rhabdonatronobacter sediminivivens]